ncbi:MAG: hypothetical protein M1814_003448 [Vezdaea aestivalis]|nr:MAG: hypothetical protein M1814_003448 [Vezdaea aestivalis]
MKFNDEEASLLKQWIVKRIENVSDASADADPDVLAEFVLTLLGHDQPEEELRMLCSTELQTFLENDTANALVSDIFTALAERSYLPEAVLSTTTAQFFNPPSGPSRVQNNLQGGRGSSQRPQQSRKRGWQDVEDMEMHDAQQARLHERSFKQARRAGNARGGRADGGLGRGRSDLGQGRGGRPPPMGPYHSGLPSSMGQQTPPGGLPFSAPPSTPQGFPFDPSQDPMGAILAMQQAMGLPPLPGMPSFPQVGNGLSQFGTNQEYDPKSAILPDLQLMQSVKTNSNGTSRGRGSDRSRGGGLSRGEFSSSRKGGRADFSLPGPSNDRSLSAVVIENIPEESFKESKVQEFFGQFGTIDKVEMQAYKRLAVVYYQSNEMAKRAYNSPKVIFDNRFVKVYWYKPDAQNKPTNGAATHGKSSGQSTDADAMVEDAPSLEEIAKKQADLQKQHEEKSKRKEATEKQQRELDAKKEELARAQAEETTKLMDKIAARSKAKKSSQSGSPITENGPIGAPEEESDEESRQLKKMLESLRKKATGLGIDPDNLSSARTAPGLDTPLGDGSRGRGRGRPGYRGRAGYFPRGRGSYDPSHSRGGYRGRGWGGDYSRGTWVRPLKLDNRTKKVAVAAEGDFDSSRDEELRQHLLNVGEYESIEPDTNSKDTVVITFKDRYTADKFYHADRTLPGVGKVNLSWVNTAPMPPAASRAIDAMEIGQADLESENGPMSGMDRQEDYDIAEDDNWGVA